MKRLVLLLPVLFLLNVQARAREWPRFRGPDGSGLAQTGGIPAGFTEKDFAWRVDLPGGGVSSPVVWGDRVFLTSEGAAEGERFVLCYDAASGKELWRHKDTFQVHGRHRFNSFASGTPCLDGERLYLAWATGGTMRALALTHDGAKVWERDLGDYHEEHGSGASPALAGGLLIVVKDHVGEGESFVAGLNPATGETVWKTPRKSERTPFSTPLVTRTPDGEEAVILSSNPVALAALRARDGKVLWEVKNRLPDQRAVGSPAATNGVFYATAGSGGNGRGGVAVRPKAGGGAETIWQLKKAMPYVPSPIGYDGHFYLLGDGGVLTKARASDGEILWSERVFRNQAYSSPVIADGKILCVSRSGKVAVAGTGERFEILGEADLGEDCDATPAIAGGRVFFRTRTRLLCLPATGKPAKP